MVAISFINKTRKTKFKGAFSLDSTDYEYTMYLLPITKQKEYDEIVNYFGNRMFKGKICLDVDEPAVEDYLNNDDVSAFIMVNPVNIDNVASGTLQIYDWCNTSSTSSSKSQNINSADVWINDVCRVSSSGNTGNPLKALFYFMEQLVVQNLGKNNIKLYIEPEPDNVKVLKPKYESLGFVKNIESNPEICPNWAGAEIVMEKTGLAEETQVINFAFLEGTVNAKSATNKRTTAKGVNLKTSKHRKTHKHRKSSKRGKSSKPHYKRK
jgi:hypothetical protein